MVTLNANTKEIITLNANTKEIITLQTLYDLI